MPRRKLDLTKRKIDTMRKIFFNLPKCDKGKSVDDLVEEKELGRTAIYDYLQILITKGLVHRRKGKGGIYYYCRIGGRNEFNNILNKTHEVNK